MDINIEFGIAFRLFIAFLLGAFVGLEREMHGSPAGIRTYAAVSLGAALFTLIGLHSEDTTAASRIAANIVTGIGFLGAGIIYKDNTKGYTHGLTTASTIWATAAIGVAVAYSMFIVAVASAVAIYFLLALHHFHWYLKLKKKWDSTEDTSPKNNNE